MRFFLHCRRAPSSTRCSSRPPRTGARIQTLVADMASIRRSALCEDRSPARPTPRQYGAPPHSGTYRLPRGSTVTVMSSSLSSSNSFAFLFFFFWGYHLLGLFRPSIQAHPGIMTGRPNSNTVLAVTTRNEGTTQQEEEKKRNRKR